MPASASGGCAEFSPFGSGAGVQDMPGDYGEPARFVRTAFVNAHYPAQDSERDDTARLFARSAPSRCPRTWRRWATEPTRRPSAPAASPSARRPVAMRLATIPPSAPIRFRPATSPAPHRSLQAPASRPHDSVFTRRSRYRFPTVLPRMSWGCSGSTEKISFSMRSKHSRMGRFCGQASSQAPQRMHSVTRFLPALKRTTKPI